MFCENETNARRLWDQHNTTPFPKDGINDHVVDGAETVNPAQFGTKGAAWYRFDVPAGETVQVRLRLTNVRPRVSPSAPTSTTSSPLGRRRPTSSSTSSHPTCHPAARSATSSAARSQVCCGRRSTSGTTCASGSRAIRRCHRPRPARENGRNHEWTHLYNADIISMPDEWEYPWYAAWDLAFHMLPMAIVDPDFAKEQLLLFCREWYMHPNGQLPAYEWAFNDVNPPVHAWAAWRVYKIDGARTGKKDTEFLERIFHKLLINFAWWVNRKDSEGLNVFEGGFLGLDNIGLFDRSAPLPDGGRLAQSDATSWMAMYCLNMLAIALELAQHEPRV